MQNIYREIQSLAPFPIKNQQNRECRLHKKRWEKGTVVVFMIPIQSFLPHYSYITSKNNLKLQASVVTHSHLLPDHLLTRAGMNESDRLIHACRIVPRLSDRSNMPCRKPFLHHRDETNHRDHPAATFVMKLPSRPAANNSNSASSSEQFSNAFSKTNRKSSQEKWPWRLPFNKHRTKSDVRFKPGAGIPRRPGVKTCRDQSLPCESCLIHVSACLDQNWQTLSIRVVKLIVINLACKSKRGRIKLVELLQCQLLI